MSEHAIILDPFIEIVDCAFSAWQWSFRVQRDDGWHYTPASSESVTLRLYNGRNQQWLCSGETMAAAGELLDYEEAVSGLVSSFVFAEGYYTFTLSAELLTQLGEADLSHFSCLLESEGENTVKCLYPRRYLPGATGEALLPGYWQVTLPYWSVEHTAAYPDLRISDRITTVRSTIPYQVTWKIEDGNSFAWFRLPVLVVEWIPDAAMQGWQGLILLDRICRQGGDYIPGQTVEGVTQPQHMPQNREERIAMQYQQAAIIAAMGDCPGQWPASRIHVSSNFAAALTINFVNSMGHNPLPQKIVQEYPTALQEKIYQRRYQYIWPGDSFPYETGEGLDLVRDLQAQLIQSPYTGFEQFLLELLPEGVQG
ncbi:hypothetical protein [Candidatus Magnetaquicoccus inordinatus]|uniref:hypothetical protein n=1 Tax=Candidatus Magnetaquicoccus inordinatus TaxID=2496818 RepID=UPI00102B70EC|nr:hypothetical protein [Candidatus Magnetaquicoccus inordinatus]